MLTLCFLVFGMLFNSPMLFAQDNDSAGDTEGTDAADATDSGETDAVEEEEVDAEEEESVDEVTEDEIEDMDLPAGVQLRILQLERQLLRKILRANVVIGFLQDKGEDTSELEEIVAELELLKEDASVIPDDGEEAVKKFVDIKKETKKLVKRFRRLVRDLTDQVDRDEISSLFEDI